MHRVFISFVLVASPNCVFISFVIVAWYRVYYNSEIPSLQECVASLKGWKAAQQNTKESVHSVVFVKPVVNELTHSRRNSIYASSYKDESRLLNSS